MENNTWIGFYMGFALVAIIFVFAWCMVEPCLIFKDTTSTKSCNIVYSVKIDTVATDSLYGKTWRNK